MSDTCTTGYQSVEKHVRLSLEPRASIPFKCVTVVILILEKCRHIHRAVYIELYMASMFKL